MASVLRPIIGFGVAHEPPDPDGHSDHSPRTNDAQPPIVVIAPLAGCATGEDVQPERSLGRSRARRRMMDRRRQGWPCCHDASQPVRRAPGRLFCAVYWCSGWPYLDRTATSPGGRSPPFECQ